MTDMKDGSKNRKTTELNVYKPTTSPLKSARCEKLISKKNVAVDYKKKLEEANRHQIQKLIRIQKGRTD